MREYPARQLATGIFETGDRVRHDEHGDGTVTGTYGSKLAVDFDNVGTKRVAVESLRLAPWIPPETPQAILAERDARRNEARARYGLAPVSTPMPRQQQRHTAEIIAFPAHRILRRIEHGQGVVVS
jgi:hypothetical protein